MAIDPRIALGVQPVQQQPNMLAQYAQIMAIKAAQQEMQGSEDVRRYFSAPADQRGDISQIMHTKGGRAASETMSQNAQRDLKMQLDALGAAKQNVYMAKDPASLAEYIKGVYSSPAGKLLSTFVPVDKALAAIPADPVAFKEYQKNFGLTADQIVVNATKERGQNMTYGATVRGQDMTDARAREQVEREQAELERIRKIVSGGTTFSATAPVTPPMGVGGGPAVAPVAAPMGGDPAAAPVAGAPVNALAPTTAPSVNALAGGDARQQIAAIDAKINALMSVGPKAAPVVQSLIAQKNAIINDEKSKYGEIRPIQGVDPDTNKPTTYLARFNNLTKRFEPIPKEEVPISVGGSDGSTSSQLNAAQPPQTPTPFQTALGTKQADALVKSQEAAQDAASIIQTNQVGRDILNSGVITGSGANFFVGLNQALKTAGIDFGYGDAAANSQAYVALMAQNTAKIIKQFGAGTGLSDADREYAAKAAAGQINLDEKAIRKILDINDRASRAVIKLHNSKVKGIKSDIPLTVEMPKVGSSRVFSSQEQQALEWADANPSDPRAAQIRQRLGMQ
jgi:hypothetical protein